MANAKFYLSAAIVFTQFTQFAAPAWAGPKTEIMTALSIPRTDEAACPIELKSQIDRLIDLQVPVELKGPGYATRITEINNRIDKLLKDKGRYVTATDEDTLMYATRLKKLLYSHSGDLGFRYVKAKNLNVQIGRAAVNRDLKYLNELNIIQKDLKSESSTQRLAEIKDELSNDYLDNIQGKNPTTDLQWITAASNGLAEDARLTLEKLADQLETFEVAMETLHFFAAQDLDALKLEEAHDKRGIVDADRAETAEQIKEWETAQAAANPNGPVITPVIPVTPVTPVTPITPVVTSPGTPISTIPGTVNTGGPVVTSPGPVTPVLPTLAPNSSVNPIEAAANSSHLSEEKDLNTITGILPGGIVGPPGGIGTGTGSQPILPTAISGIPAPIPSMLPAPITINPNNAINANVTTPGLNPAANATNPATVAAPTPYPTPSSAIQQAILKVKSTFTAEYYSAKKRVHAVEVSRNILHLLQNDTDLLSSLNFMGVRSYIPAEGADIRNLLLQFPRTRFYELEKTLQKERLARWMSFFSMKDVDALSKLFKQRWLSDNAQAAIQGFFMGLNPSAYAIKYNPEIEFIMESDLTAYEKAKLLYEMNAETDDELAVAYAASEDPDTYQAMITEAGQQPGQEVYQFLMKSQTAAKMMGRLSYVFGASRRALLIRRGISAIMVGGPSIYEFWHHFHHAALANQGSRNIANALSDVKLWTQEIKSYQPLDAFEQQEFNQLMDLADTVFENGVRTHVISEPVRIK